MAFRVDVRHLAYPVGIESSGFGSLEFVPQSQRKKFDPSGSPPPTERLGPIGVEKVDWIGLECQRNPICNFYEKKTPRRATHWFRFYSRRLRLPRNRGRTPLCSLT